METAEFSYYANGLRKTKGSELYIYDGKNVFVEIDTTDIRLNVYGNALLFTIQGTITTENEVTFVDGKIAYAYEFNLHGDVVKVLGIAGIVLNTYTYDAFGVITSQSATVANTFYYAGYQYDDETGLYYLRSRYYNAETARFITEDGFKGYYDDPLSLNRYTYCHNSPIIYFDPDGEAAINTRMTDTGYSLDSRAMANELHKDDCPDWTLWVAAGAVVVTCAVLTVVSAGGFAPAAASISCATVNSVLVGTTLTTTVCAYATVGAGLGFIGTAIYAGIDAVSEFCETGDFEESLDTFSDYGSTALLSTTTGAIVGAAEGYGTYKEGNAGEGKEWHHIVEQNQIEKSGIDPRLVYSTDNTVAIDYSTHRQISGYYSSKQELTDYIKVRDWLTGKTFDEQFEFE